MRMCRCFSAPASRSLCKRLEASSTSRPTTEDREPGGRRPPQDGGSPGWRARRRTVSLRACSSSVPAGAVDQGAAPRRKGWLCSGQRPASAAVLHFRGTPDALLATDSFVGATFSVVFWALPAFALYLLIPWSRTAIVIEGLLILALLVTTWWSSATDTHSTASLGPGFAGWIFAPAIIILGVIVTAVARRLAKGRGRDAR